MFKKNNQDKLIRQTVKKAQYTRIAWKTIQNSSLFPFKNRVLASVQLSHLNRKSFPSRIKNRCVLTGRSHAVYRYFKLSRIKLKEMATLGLLPGIKKAIW